MLHKPFDYLKIALNKLLYHWRLSRNLKRGRVQAQAAVSLGKDIYLEVGAGEKAGQGNWTTLDLLENADIFWDTRLGLPFPDNSIALIYSSHFMEHLDFEQGEAFLKEAYRVLKPGGKFSISVPDASIYIKAYSEQRSPDGEGFFGHFPAYNHTTAIDYINYVAYMDGHHKYMFDADNLQYRLKNCGLQNVKQRAFDASMDMDWRDFESIYAEGCK